MLYSGSMVILSNVYNFRNVTTKVLSGKSAWETEIFSEKTKQMQMSH